MTRERAQRAPRLERVMGSLAGVAIGDAMGMPCEFLTRQQIAGRYGRLDRFVEPAEGHIHAGTRTRGQVTDDTEQTLALAFALIQHGTITPEIAAQAYMKWARETDAFNSSVLGPSSRRALERIAAGDDPRLTGCRGDTVGAAMRVAPIGLVNAGQLERAVEECYLSCLPTHGVSIAIGGACAVACAVAAAAVRPCRASIRQPTHRRDRERGPLGAERGEERGIKWAGASAAARTRLALRIVDEARDPAQAEEELYSVCGVGMNPTELVPTAIGIVSSTAATVGAAWSGREHGRRRRHPGRHSRRHSRRLPGDRRLPRRLGEHRRGVNDIDFRRLAEQLLAVIERRNAHDSDVSFEGYFGRQERGLPLDYGGFVGPVPGLDDPLRR